MPNFFDYCSLYFSFQDPLTTPIAPPAPYASSPPTSPLPVNDSPSPTNNSSVDLPPTDPSSLQSPLHHVISSPHSHSPNLNTSSPRHQKEFIQEEKIQNTSSSFEEDRMESSV